MSKLTDPSTEMLLCEIAVNPVQDVETTICPAIKYKKETNQRK